MAEIVWTNTAIFRLKEIYDYIALDSAFYAEKLVHNIYTSAERLINYPDIGSVVSSKKNIIVRRLLFKRYKLVYVHQNEKVFIITVIHQSQLLKLDFEEIRKMMEEE